MENEDPFEVRVGTFFVVVGMGVFLLFVVSDVADQTEFDYFFGAMILLAIGYYLRRKKAPPPPSGRFSGFKGAWQKMRARKDKGGDGKDKKDKK
jgi:uncharacterized membrane protein YfcA